MVFLIDHHAQRFFTIQHQPAARAFGGVFAADKMAFDENLLVERRKRLSMNSENAPFISRQAFNLPGE